MNRFIDWFARNRSRIGGYLGMLYGGIISIDPQLVAAHPRLIAYAGLLLGVIFGGGKFGSDQEHKEAQAARKMGGDF